jgi:endonuclease YncB( thermonuclease family)
MKNEHFAFINTTDKDIVVVYDFLDADGNQHRSIDVLPEKSVISDSTAKSYLQINKGFTKAKLLDVSVSSSKDPAHVVNAKSVMRPDAFGSINEILKNSVIFDIETLGRGGGDTITQLGLYDVETGKGTMIVAQPQLIAAPVSSPDMRFKSRLGTYEEIPKGTTFKQIKYAETLAARDGESFQDSLTKVRANNFELDKLEAHLLDTDYFQGRYFATDDNLRAALERRGNKDVSRSLAELRPIRTFMQALDGGISNDQVEALLRASRGADASLSELFKGGFELTTDRSMRDILTQDLPDLLRGKVTWIANAAFESTQFGAQIDAEAKMGFDALNVAREAEGLNLIKERDFMARYSYGGYESEINKLNAIRETTGETRLIPKSPMMGVISGISTSSGKPFYVTGKEFLKARSKAFKSGNFSDLYESFIKTTGAGDVRDIIDLARMQQSMLIDEGIIQSSDRPSSLSVEVQARIFGVTERLREGYSADDSIQKMFDKELHIGIGDARLSEYPILRESLEQLEALNIVKRGLPGSEELVKQARQGEGALFRAQVYGKIMERLNTTATDAQGKPLESLQDVTFKQRAGRYALDLAETGSYDLRKYAPGFGVIRQAKQIGDAVFTEAMQIPRSISTPRVNFNELIEDMTNLDDYKSARKDVLIGEIKDHFKGTYDEKTGQISQPKEFSNRARSYSESSNAQISAIQSRFKKGDGDALREIMTEVKKHNLLTRKHVSRQLAKATPGALGGFSSGKTAIKMGSIKIPAKAKKGYLGAVGVLLGASFLPKSKKKNIFLGGESEYLRANFEDAGYESSDDFETAIQTKYGNVISGMSESGLASLLRKMTTDFGSPYRSPEYSLSVLDNHKLRRERERYVSAQFGARHFSPDGDIGFFLRRFTDSFFRRELGISRDSKTLLLTDGKKIEAGRYNSLRGNNLIEYTLNNSNDISVEDADTITIRNVNDTNRSLKVRLAGIDAPETAHSDRGAQPYAEAAKQIAIDMISKAKDVRVVMQPGDATYGRQVGMVYADGINVNLELLKRGAAAYLPYRSKSKPPIYNQRAFEEAQERAYASKRGMWKESYFQAYKMISEKSNQSVTFNTLVNNSKIAKNGHLMSMRTMMDQAQEMGIDNTLGMQLANLGDNIAGQEKPFSPDNLRNNWSSMDLQTYGSSENSILTLLDRQKHEIGHLMRTRGSNTSENKNKASRVTQRNVELTSETLASRGYNEETEMRTEIKYNAQQRKIKRLETMQYLQHNALRNQFNSPIGHHRM